MIIATSISASSAAVIALATSGMFAAPNDPPEAPVEMTGVETELETEGSGLSGHPGHEMGSRGPGPMMPPEAEAAEPADWFGGKPWWEWKGALGNLGGSRSTLEERGLTFAGSFTLNWSSVFDGGVRRGASTRSLLDLNLTADLGILAGIEGGTVYADFYSSDVRGGSREIGDALGYDVLETGQNVHQLAELWYEQIMADGAVRVKIGKVDANAEFALSPGVDFIHTVGTFDPTTGLLPTYPNPALGVNLFVTPCEGVYVGLGVYDGSLAVGVPTGRTSGFHSLRRGDEIFYVGEAGLTWNELDASEGLGVGRISFGAHYNTATAERFDGGSSHGTGGVFGLAEQQIATRGDATPSVEGDDDDPKGAFLFLHGGVADEEVALVKANLTAGLYLRGTFADRADDTAGVLVSYGVLSRQPGSGATSNEIVFEVYYGIALTPWLTIKPDIQYISSPGGDAAVDDALIGAIQFRVDF